MSKTKTSQWESIKEPVINYSKVYLLTRHAETILKLYEKRIQYLVYKYTRYLPYHVAQSEKEDLSTLANLELIEVLKVWDPEKNDAVWPLARVRMVGAMKDHIRHVTKSDPTRLYDWINDAASIYLSMNKRADFEQSIETGMQLNDAMKVLNKRERKIVIDHSKKDLTFKQIGESISVSESQVSRIYKKAIEKMRKEIMPKHPLLKKKNP